MKTEDQAKILRDRMTESRKASGSAFSLEKARIISVTSGKGGVGKTNIATNMAITLSKMHKRVLVLDADLGLANIDVILGLNPKFNLRHVVSGEKSINDVVIDGPSGVRIVPGCSGIQELSELNAIDRESFIRGFSVFDDDVDIVIIDTSAGIGNNVISFLLASQEIVLVTTPEPAAITDAYAMIKVIHERNKEKNIGLLVNMSQSAYEAQAVTDNIRLVSKHFLGKEIGSYGFVMRDGKVSDAIRRQKPFVNMYPGSAASRGVMQVGRKIA